jgi:predicted MFS family arabinose efflux permease
MSSAPTITRLPTASTSGPAGRLGRNASYWTAAFVIALCLWGSGAPSLLYPVYASTWHLTPTITTTVFAAYPLALVIMLFVAGGVSDRIGRRATLLAGMIAMGASVLAFIFATDLTWLYVGRLLQGMATGLSLSAAGAALLDNDVKRNPVRVSSTTTVANAAGLTLASVVTGALLQYAPLPRHLTFIVLFALVITATVLVLLMPSPVSSNSGSWKLQRISVPANVRRLYIVAAIPVSVVFCVGALLLSLGASMVRELLHTNNAFIAGITLSVLTVSLAATGLLLRNLRPHTSIISGGLVAAVSLGLLQWSAVTGSLGLFLVAGAVSGASYALSFSGGLRLINHAAPVAHRSGLLAALYLAAYASQGVIAVLAGLFTTAHGLHATLDLFVPILAAAALASVALGWHDARSRAATT